MRWVVLLFLFATPLQAQESLREYPRVDGVSSVTVVETFLFFDLDGLTPQPEFRVWWAEVEECTGLTKPFDEIGWYVADIIYNISGWEAWGIWYADPPEIVVVRAQTVEFLEDTVKHEALHHLVNESDHTESEFAHCIPMGLVGHN